MHLKNHTENLVQRRKDLRPRMIKKRGIAFKQEIFVLYFGIRDSRTPLYAKLIAFLALAYLISPIDLIPDFIPVAGYLDDLIIVPLLLHIAFLLLPSKVKESAFEKARKQIKQVRVALFILILILLGLLLAIFLLLRAVIHQI